MEYSQLQFKGLLSGRGKENAMCHFEIGWYPTNSTMSRALNVVYEGCKTTNTMNESKAKKTCPLEGEVGPLECVMPPRKKSFCSPSLCHD